jgi:threonine dehydratase
VIELEEIRRAGERLGEDVLRTPLVPFGREGRIWLKLECLQPVGAFKLRGALNAMRSQPPQDVVTASAGNMGYAVAWAARALGVKATIVAPESAPRAKLDKIDGLGGQIVLVPYEEWWQAMVDRGHQGIEGLFVHPVTDEAVMAGNGTIGLELAEDAPDFDTVVIPWGGGGLTSGIASALDALRPEVRVVTAEPETGAPLAAAFAAGEPCEIEFTPSWVDGAGGPSLLPGMWERARDLVDEAVAVPLVEVEEAVRLLAARDHVVAEGAGALALAAAMRRDDSCVCIVSGGNIDLDVYAGIVNPAATA